MKKLWAALAAATALCAVCTPASAATAAVQAASDQAAELAEARAIIAIMFPPAQRQQMMAKMMENVTTPMRQALNFPGMDDPGLKRILDDFLNRALAEQLTVANKHFPHLLEAMATAYSSEFTIAELRDIHAFARTPAGSHYLSKSTAILGNPAVMKANTSLFAESKAVTDRLMPELKAQVTDYLAKHPEVLEKFSPRSK